MYSMTIQLVNHVCHVLLYSNGADGVLNCLKNFYAASSASDVIVLF